MREKFELGKIDPCDQTKMDPYDQRVFYEMYQIHRGSKIVSEKPLVQNIAKRLAGAYLLSYMVTVDKEMDDPRTFRKKIDKIMQDIIDGKLEQIADGFPGGLPSTEESI